MHITVKKIREDTKNFFLKQISIIFGISIAVALITIITDIFIKPDMHIIAIINNKKFFNAESVLDFINSMNEEEKYELLKYAVLKMIALLISKTLLTGIMILFISALSQNKKKPIKFIINSVSDFLPTLFILNFAIVLCTQFGFMFFIAPGIGLSILLSLAPIILYFNKNNVINTIKLSLSISWKYISILGPGIILWVFSKFIVTEILTRIHILHKNVIFLILNVSTNILYSILIIYLFRFYMLILNS